MTFTEVIDLYWFLCAKFNLVGWGFKINDNVSRLGCCKYKEKRIEISCHHLKSPEYAIKQTLLHEIAHALTPG